VGAFLDRELVAVAGAVDLLEEHLVGASALSNARSACRKVSGVSPGGIGSSSMVSLPMPRWFAPAAARRRRGAAPRR
jgi:hypothetical protein